MKSKINKILEITLALCLIGLIFEAVYIYYDLPRKITHEPENSAEIKEPIPESFELDIPFITQAPFRNWKEEPFNHTCEEAAVLMVHYYLEEIKEVDENQTKKELLDLVDFQIKNYGFHEDTSTAQTAKLIKDYYGYKTQVYYDISLEDIKKEISKGNPVIIPTAGRLLENPNYTPPGPVYHMLVIKGYNQNGFITQDPGTYRSGKNKTYSNAILEKAIHDWDENEKNIEKTKSAMIVVTL
ncbi:MAG: C39 family peptidase [Minisyncoccales bacterium]